MSDLVADTPLSDADQDEDVHVEHESEALLVRRGVIGAGVRRLRSGSVSSGPDASIEMAQWPYDSGFNDLSMSVGSWDGSVTPISDRFSWNRLFMFMGPGFLVSIAYIDPGNFDTDIAAGAQFKYDLIWVLVAATMLGLLLQNLAARLGVVTGLNLAEVCKVEYPGSLRFILWVIAEVTIIASDIPEVIGTAFALNFLCGIPLWIGVIITSFSVLLFLAVSHFGVRKLEFLIGLMIGVVVICFVAELFLSSVSVRGMLGGLIPSFDYDAAYTATSLIGAVVMPHNLFLHSAIVQTRPIRRTIPALREAVFYNLIESAIALSVSLFINIAVLSMSAAEFFPNTKAGLLMAPALMQKVLKGSLGSTLFSVSLLASGQSSTMTGTYAGQFVMEGFLDLKMKKWVRAMFTRSVAIVPSLAVALMAGSEGADNLIILSQVLLSILLPFALIPLVKITNSAAKMGEFANDPWTKFAATFLGAGVTVANLSLVYGKVEPWLIGLAGAEALLARLVSAIVMVGYLGLLSYLLFRPVSSASLSSGRTIGTPVSP